MSHFLPAFPFCVATAASAVAGRWKRGTAAAIIAIATLPLAAQYVPPVPIGIKTDAKVRAPHPLEFPSEKLRWARVRTAHFDVISSATPEQTQEIASDLETVAAVLKRISPRFQSAAEPTTVFVFSDRAESDDWFELLLGPGNHRLGGAYVRRGGGGMHLGRAGGGTMLIDAANTKRIARTAMHELVHDLLRQGELVPPLWLEEGLAEYFSGARVEEHRLEAGTSVPQHAALLRRGRQLMPLETLFAVQPETDAAIAPLFYAQSWAAVDWLMQLDNTLFYAFLEDLERGTPVADALAARYHKTLDDLDSAIRRRGRVSGATVRFASDGIVAIPEPAELDRATLLFEMGRFLSIVPGAEKDADRHLREAVRIDPKQARALALLGRYDEAVAAAPDDPDVLLGAAEALMKTATGSFAGVFEPEAKDAAAFRKARQLAEHAAAVLHDSNLAGNALGVVGTSYLVETDVAPGIAALERAVTLVPQRADFALNLYRLYLRTGQRPKADALFASTFANTRDKQLAFAARNILLSAEIERANQLSREGKLDEAATLVRELAAATEDAKAKHELEAQAVQLDATAAVNRQIRMYNQAIVYVNTSHNADALKILDAILKEATDPLVIADARRLRDELRKKK